MRRPVFESHEDLMLDLGMDFRVLRLGEVI